MKDMVDAFEARNLDEEMAVRMGATHTGQQWAFEYRLDGEFRYRKVRRVSDGGWQIEPSGQQKNLLLWNLDVIRDLSERPNQPLVITEGEFDAIAVAQACGGYVVSVPNGSSGKQTEGEIKIAEDYAYCYLWSKDLKLIPELEQFDKVILATDGDEKGQILRDELAMRIGPTRCWFVEYPEGCKDANDVLMHYDEATLRKVIAGAQPMQPGHLIKPSEVPPRERSVTYSTGWGKLDEHLMLVRPELVVVTGIPGHGKSQWVRSLCFHLAASHGMRTAFLTPEDPPDRLQRDMTKFAEAGQRVSYHERKMISRDFMDAHFMISHPPDDDLITLEMVMDEMESAALHYNCQVFVLDPWNEVYHNRGRRSDTEYVEMALMQLKRKARRLNMIFIIVAHPTKLEDGKKPRLYDISGSANWKNKCDHGIIIHRLSENSSQVEVIVEKAKDHETMGEPGAKWMEFNRGRADFDPIDAA
jgi:twinkle protein